MKRAWLTPIIVVALGIVAAVVYLATSHSDEASNTTASEAATAAPSPVAPSNPSSALASCVGPMNSQVSLQSLNDRHKLAESLSQRGHLDTALAQLRSIATLDPGYPAINSDIADVLLKSKRTSEARNAITLQIEISGCLSGLQPSDLQLYCRSEWSSEPEGQCEPDLARIGEKANYQAGLIEAELAQVNEPRKAAAGSADAASPKLSHTVAQTTTASTPGGNAPAQQNALAVAPASVPAPVPAKPVSLPAISSTEAASYVGQQRTVCGSVISKHTAEDSNGKPTFVNLDRSYPDQTFTIVIWGTDAEAVGTFPDSGRVCATGTISMYRGNPEIVVHDSKSWYRSAQP